jgi:hypothetical protein
MATIPEDAVRPDATDDPGFLAKVRGILFHVVELQAPSDLYVVRVRNWFDYKWVGFGGKVIGAVGRFPAELTIPPFKPNRVLLESTFSRNPSGEYAQVHDAAKLHIDIPSARAV